MNLILTDGTVIVLENRCWHEIMFDDGSCRGEVEVDSPYGEEVEVWACEAHKENI